MEQSIMQLTTLTQFGARRSIAALHIKCLLSNTKNYDVNHIFYLVDANNKKLEKYLRSYEDPNKIIVYSQSQNDYTNFRRLRRKAKYGGDCNYDYLIRLPEVREYFLTLHDDTLLQSQDALMNLRSKMRDFDFYGLNDTRREITGYQNILIDDIPMSDLRIGTFFFCGNTRKYLTEDYKIGDYTNYLSWQLKWRYKFSKRLKFNAIKIWLNGGFDFNIRARLMNEKISYDYSDPSVEHFNKLTGFFAATKRNMLQYSDTPEEVDRWREYVERLMENGQLDQLAFDYDYLLGVATLLEEHKIYDEFINKTTLAMVFKV